MYFWWYTDWYNGPAYERRLADGKAGSAPVNEPAATKSPDQRLVHALAHALLHDPALKGGRIELEVQNGVAILDGEVDSVATRRAAVARAWSVTGVADVCDSLKVTTKRAGRA